MDLRSDFDDKESCRQRAFARSAGPLTKKRRLEPSQSKVFPWLFCFFRSPHPFAHRYCAVFASPFVDDVCAVKGRRLILVCSMDAISEDSAGSLQFRERAAGSRVELCSTNELGRVAADLLAVQHVDHAQLLNCRIAELAKRQMYPVLLEASCQTSPPGAGRQGAEQCDVL